MKPLLSAFGGFATAMLMCLFALCFDKDPVTYRNLGVGGISVKIIYGVSAAIMLWLTIRTVRGK